MNRVPNMTPYRSGLPIDSLPPARANDPDLKRRIKVYQGIVGSINWLATCNRPDIAPVLTFLASYSTKSSKQHYKAAIHALKYLYSTSKYGVSFHSNASNTLQAFNHFPHHHDRLTPTQLLRLRLNSIDLPHSATLAGVANSATQSPAVPRLNSLSIDLSPNSSSADAAVPSHGMQIFKS